MIGIYGSIDASNGINSLGAIGYNADKCSSYEKTIRNNDLQIAIQKKGEDKIEQKIDT